MLASLFEILTRNIRALGFLAIVICAVTWWIDLAGLVHECVYCRTQRTAIGVAGILMVLPNPRQWWIRFATAAVCFLGASIAVDQLFLVIKSINAGKSFGVLNLVLATGALFTLTGQALLLFTSAPEPSDNKPDET
jgi:hypothetical protein